MKERFCCGQPIKSNKRVAPTISAPLHLILRAPSPAFHEWKKVPAVKRLCQICHLVVDAQGLKCKSCGLRAHPQCGNSYPPGSSTDAVAAFGQDNSTSDRLGTTNNYSSRVNRKPRSLQPDLHFEPRIKKILQVPLLSSIESGCEERHSGGGSSGRFSSSCGDSVAASTAIVVGTVSIETPRSESKTPEITITPGSDVAAVETENDRRHRSSSGSASELPDSGCTGLLDDEEESHRAESSLPGCSSRGRKNGSGGLTPGQQKGLLYVDGPLDGSPYAVINPLVKQKSLADSGISVDQMKDLDRLISALVEEAESIDIPYHARQDSLPFSYTSPQSITSHNEKRLQQQSSSQSQPSPSYSSSAVDSRQPLYSSPYAAINSEPTNGGRNTQQSYHSSIEEQMIDPQPIGLSRSISHQPSSYSSSSYGQRQPPSSLGFKDPPVSHSFSDYGNGTGGGGRRMRSQSADGRRDFERDEDADEWLARQMKKLQEKKATKHPMKNDLLAELKRTLPGERLQSSERSYPMDRVQLIERSLQNERLIPIQRLYQNERALQNDRSLQYERPVLQNVNDRAFQHERFHPVERSQSHRQDYSTSEIRSSSSSRAEASGVSSRANNVSYSSDDDDDVEMEVFHRGRKIQRHQSEAAYDRGYTSSSSTRAPSQQSYVETPFPICPPTPYTNRPTSPGKPPRSPKLSRRYQGSSSAPIGVIDVLPSRSERAMTPVNPRPIFMVDSEVKFAQDISEYWYKPYASREETVAALLRSPSGSFVIRNSNSFPGAYGLAIKVSDTSGEKGIRHFLIEPTKFGVRLRGCGTLEPVFSSLSALVYAHSIESLALPTTLTLPVYDILQSSQSQSTTAHLLRQGAACQLLFLGMMGVECLSGDEAIQRGISEISASSPVPISLRLSRSGLTLTDVFRKQFFRIHFALTEISYAAVVPGRSVAYGREVKQVFGVVARAPRAAENSVILLAELEHGQPANAIVSFILRVIAWQQH